MGHLGGLAITLANWDLTKSNASLTVAIENNRLKMDNDVIKGSVAESYAHLRLNSDFSRGFTIGKIRTKLEITDHTLSTSNDGFYGILCMMSQSDLTGGAGSCYVFGLSVQATITWAVLKHTAGLENIAAMDTTTLGSGDTTLTPARDVNYTLELQWAYHTLIGGTNLVCKVGLAENNFDDLVTVYDVTDTSSPLSASVGEGLFFADTDGTSSDLKRIYYDDTTIVSLSGIPI